MPFEDVTRQILCQQIRGLLLGVDLFNANMLQLMVVAHEVHVQFDVFVASRDDGVFDHFYARAVVFLQNGGFALSAV